MADAKVGAAHASPLREMRVRASSSVAAAEINGLPDRRQLVLPARCLKSNVAELRLYKVCWQIQPRNWELASPATPTGSIRSR